MLSKRIVKAILFSAIVGVALLAVYVTITIFFGGGASSEKKDEEATRGAQYSASRGEVTTPSDELSSFELGEYYFNPATGGEYDLIKARHYYTEALRKNPTGYLRAWYQLGRIDFIEGKFGSAIYKFEKQIEYFGDEVPNVYYMLGLTYGYLARETEEEVDWQKAEASFQKFIEFAPTSPWPRVDLAWVYFSQGKYAEMLPVLEEGLVYQPNHAWLLNTYGLALLNIDERKRAHEQFLKARDVADALTVEDWGRAYTGNDPKSWEGGLAEFRAVIAYNLKMSE